MNDFEKGLADVMGSFMEINLDCVEKQNQEIEQLQQENQQLKEVIEEVRKYINKHSFFVNDTGYGKIIGYPKESYNADDLLQILDKGVKDK